MEIPWDNNVKTEVIFMLIFLIIIEGNMYFHVLCNLFLKYRNADEVFLTY